jgi:hypothetical protein
MRHFLMGALLIVAALAVTSVTASLLERAAMNRQTMDSPTAIVEGPGTAPSPGKANRPGELSRQVILVSRRLASGLRDQ